MWSKTGRDDVVREAALAVPAAALEPPRPRLAQVQRGAQSGAENLSDTAAARGFSVVLVEPITGALIWAHYRGDDAQPLFRSPARRSSAANSIGDVPEPGAIIAFTTPEGTAYAQYTHHHPEMGDVIRVLPGIYATLPDLTDLAHGPHRFLTFYPLDTAIRHRDARLVGVAPIPEVARAFPCWRWSPSPITGPWWLWDGATCQRVDRLDAAQAALPVKAVHSHGALLARIMAADPPT